MMPRLFELVRASAQLALMTMPVFASAKSGRMNKRHRLVQEVLQLMRRRTGVVRPGGKRNRERQEHSRNRGVNSGAQHQEPHHHPTKQIRCQCGHFEKAIHHDEHPPNCQRPREIKQGKLRRVEDGDDDDRAQIIDHRKSDDEDFKRRGDAATEDGQHAEREGDIRRHGNADAGCRRRAGIRRKVNERREGQSADGCENREKCILKLRKFAVVELAFELQADHEKKDRHERVVYPMRHAQPADRRLPEAHVSWAET